MIEDNQSGIELGGEGGATIGNKWLESEFGLALMGAVAELLVDKGTHHADAGFICKMFFYQNYDDWFEIALEDLVRNNKNSPGHNGHLDVIKHSPRHFLNIGQFKRDQRLTTYMQRNFQSINHVIATKWEDSGIMAQTVHNILKSGRVGSGSGARGGGKTLAEKLLKKQSKLQPTVALESWSELLEAGVEGYKEGLADIAKFAAGERTL